MSDARFDLLARTFATPIPCGVARPWNAKLVLLGLALHATPDGRSAYPSRARLAEGCALCPRTIDRILRDLRRVDLIAEEAPPSFSRPRTYRLLIPCAQPVENLWTPAGGEATGCTNLLPGGWQVDRTGADKPREIATDQVQEQEQVQKQEQEAPGNYRVILRIAHTVLDVVGTRCSMAEVVEAVKDQCQQAHLVYWPGTVVNKAVAAAIVARVGRPADPVALRELRALERRRR